MYSVLIQNQSTMESFHEFHPFFMEGLLNNQIGVCRWVESGNTIETAVPELRDLTAEKEHWRAIIVRVTDEAAMREAKADPSNPYDFEIYKKQPKTLEESPIPLIRLTHILGGVPAPSLDFEKRIVEKDEDHEEQVYYKPVKNQKKEAAYEELEQKYAYDGKRPTEILLVTFHRRCKKRESADVQFVWNNYLEIHSSDFWQRNNYPAQCRFLKYDYEEQGPVIRTADLFDFWASVMLLAENNLNPSSLQGYRVYNIHTDFNKEKMFLSFQERVNQLVGTKNYISLEIKRDLEEKASIDEMAVMDFATVGGLEIRANVSNSTMQKVAEDEFHICGRTSNEDMGKWNRMRDEVESNLESLYKRADRELEKGTDRMRLRQHVEDEDVKPINHFQEEDIRKKLNDYYVKILNGQSKMTGLMRQSHNKMDAKAQIVKENIVQRLLRIHAVQILEFVIAVVLVCCVPAIFLRKIDIAPTVLPSLLLMAALIVVYVIAEFAVLKLQHFKFLKKVDAYNDEVERAHEDLANCTNNLTNFVQDVVAYARGCDYLSILARKKFKTGYTYDALQRHMKATNLFLDKLRKWSKAFYLDINFSPETRDNFKMDIDLSPQNNFLYTFENGKEYAVPLNETGEEVYSPFEFIEKLNIDREEFFENAGIDEGNCSADGGDSVADGASDAD